MNIISSRPRRSTRSSSAANGSRRGSVTAIVVAAVAGATAIGFAVSSLTLVRRTSPLPAVAESIVPAPASGAEIGALLFRLGLAPERLAAAGLSSSQTTTLVGNLRTHLAEHIDALRSADAAYNTARTLVESFERTVRAGTSTAEDRQALAAARTQLASHATTRQSAMDSAYSAAAAGLSGGTLQSLARAFTNASWELPGQSYPIQYAFADRSESDWVTLREALSNDRIAEKHGLEPNQAAQDFIAAADADSAVSAASANLQARLAEVRSAWFAAVQQ